MALPALLIAMVVTAWLLSADLRHRPQVSPAVWVAVAWLVLISTRPVSSWFAGGGGDVAQGYDEGDPFDRVVYFVLMLAALAVLRHRGVRLREVAAANAMLLAFFGYWALSVLWADAPFVAAKRWVKDVGNLLMVLLLLTDRDPVAAAKSLLVRCAALVLPLSVMLIRFVPELGRTFHPWTGEMMVTGLATHKNSLGMIAALSLMALGWDLHDRWRARGPLSPMRPAAPLLLAAVAAWLMLSAGSASALTATVLAAGLAVVLRSAWCRRHLALVGVTTGAVALALWAFDATDAITRYVVVDLLGRDMTLTTRTAVWPALLERVGTTWTGSGFNSFWTGDRLVELYEQLQIIQAHNGYLETYLNGGWLGVIALALLVLSSLRRLSTAVAAGTPGASALLVIALVVLVYNFSEACFNKMSPLWLVFLLAVMRGPGVVAREVEGREPAAPPAAWPRHAGWR